MWKPQIVLTTTLLAALLPVLYFLGLPFRINLGLMLSRYFVGGTIQSCVAVLVFLAVQDTGAALGVLKRTFSDVPRAALFVVLCIFLWWLAHGQIDSFVFWLTIAVAALCIYANPPAVDLKRFLRTVAWPAVYLFITLVMVFSYETIAAQVRPYALLDGPLLRADRLFLFGSSVSALSQKALGMPWAGHVLEFVYYALFAAIGGTLMWLGAKGSQEDSLRFVVDIATAYYLTLAIYWLVPSMGPFVFTFRHAAPAFVKTQAYQTAMMEYLQAARASPKLFKIAVNYFIAFPAMHLAQSALVSYHLRRWSRLFWISIAFNLFLVPAIIALEWHYFVDLLGGLAVAFIAVKLRRFFESSSAARGSIAAGAARISAGSG